MKHLHIVAPYGSAAMQRMMFPLTSELPRLYEVTTSGEVDPDADLNYHVPWHTLVGLEERGAGKHAMLYTHCNAGAQNQLMDACSRADLIVCMSFEGRRELIEMGVEPRKLWTIYAAADGFKFKQRTIGVVGYPQPNGRKREGLLLDLAWQHDLSAFQFLFLGVGWDETAEKLASLGVTVAGCVHADTPERIVAAYQVMDVLLVTGYVEGGPLPLLEAMASGVPVLSPRFGYAADLLEDEYIYEDAADLVGKLGQLTEPAIRHHQLARINTWANYAAEHALAFGRLLGESVDLYPDRGASRYAQLLDIIDEMKPESICEIGTWNGQRAVQMLQEAAKWREMDDLSYQGFDLFEQFQPRHVRSEHTKIPVPVAMAEKLIGATGAHVELVAGDTRETMVLRLWSTGSSRLFFVDGGHSERTIASDAGNVFFNLAHGDVAVFDDYYHAGKPDGMGCNRLIDGLSRDIFDITHLPARTTNAAGTEIGMVKVRRKDASVRVPMQTETYAGSGARYDGGATYSLPPLPSSDAPRSAGV